MDYEPVSEEVTFPPSPEQVASLFVNVTLIDDSSVTGDVKQFQASLNTSLEGVLFASDNQTATVNIFDDDRKSVVPSISLYIAAVNGSVPKVIQLKLP